MKKSKSSKLSSNKNLTPNKESVKNGKKDYIPKYIAPHMIIPAEDINWSKKQKLPVLKLWLECWDADPYGSRMMQLNTELPYSTFMKAKKVIADAGLFVFKAENSIRDSRETVYWQVQNLHGSRVASHWEKINSLYRQSNTPHRQSNAPHRQLDSLQGEFELPKTLLHKNSSPPSATSQQHLSNSSKEVLWCAELSADKESGTKSADEKLIKLSVSPLNPALEKLCNEGSLDGVMSLEGHFEAAKEGIMAPQEVMEELRNSKYWTAYVAIALANGWSIERPEQTMTLEARQRMETLIAKKKKPWLKEMD